MPELKMEASYLTVVSDDFFVTIKGAPILWATYKPFIIKAQELNEQANIIPSVDFLNSMPNNGSNDMVMVYHRADQYALLFALAANFASTKSFQLARELYAVSSQLIETIQRKN